MNIQRMSDLGHMLHRQRWSFSDICVSSRKFLVLKRMKQCEKPPTHVSSTMLLKFCDILFIYNFSRYERIRTILRELSDN